ncbi:inositol monophosphatase family protein [Paenalcaligenes hominis]|uniref:inositol monophosphatase family protein n=1 Tax=Paenalcaligenes hominis TaxID=643674 RepID=UPI0035251FD9
MKLPRDLQNHLATAKAAAQAGAVILQAYAGNRSELVIDTKMRNDLVSQADREAEQAVIRVLQEQTPEFGIVAEESGGTASQMATWCIDPLDGTTNFLHGIPHYAVSIALIAHAGTEVDGHVLSQDTPIIGVVYDPNRDEMFSALYNGGAWLNGQPIRCSQASSLAESVVATGFPFRDFSFANQYMPTLHQAIESTRGLRRLGAAALDLAWVACGRFDAYWEMGLAPWDVAAGTVIVREAGGISDDMYEQQPWPERGYIYAGNPKTAPELLALLQPHLVYPTQA